MFGPYELQSLLGVGGMGEVYRAYDTIKDRTVAVKLLRTEMSADAGLPGTVQARVADRGETAGTARHPGARFRRDRRSALHRHAARRGRQRQDELRGNGPLEPARAASIIGQVAAALDAAHASGLVHRDIKPENVLLTARRLRVPRRLRHRVPRRRERRDECRRGHRVVRLHGAGTVHRRAGWPGGRHLLAGMPALRMPDGSAPFPTGELRQLMGAHIMSPPPRPSITGPSLSAAFDAVVTRGMAKQPEERFSSAGDLARAASAAAAAAQVPTAINPETEQDDDHHRIGGDTACSKSARTNRFRAHGNGRWPLRRSE